MMNGSGCIEEVEHGCGEDGYIGIRPAEGEDEG